MEILNSSFIELNIGALFASLFILFRILKKKCKRLIDLQKDCIIGPVIENDQLVGLVTEGTIAQASPSKATSLSIYEMNYLLNKTKVKDVMIRDVVTVSGYASLEDATYLMLKNKIGILPVVDNYQVYGVITDRDVFQAFLEIAGYGEEGIRVRFITENEVGVLGKIVSLIVEENLNISHTVNIPRKDGKVVIEVQIDGMFDLSSLKDKFEGEGIQVEEITRTSAKVL